MKTRFFKFIFGFSIVLIFSGVWGTTRPLHFPLKNYYSIGDSVKGGSDTLPYPFKDRKNDKYTSDYKENPIYLKDPSNIQSKVEYDPVNKVYNIEENIGKNFYRNPSYLTFDEYLKKEFEKSTKNYWKKKTSDENILQRKPLIPKIFVGGEVFDRIFGGNSVDIKPQGSAELIFGWTTNRNNNPQAPEKSRKVTTFNFQEKIQLNVVAAIGDKLKLSTNYNTEATFDFENQMKLEYTGYEDEIIKKIEAGNVNLPLTSSLISGSQSLFGIKTQLQFGRLTVTSIFSQQKGKTSTIEVAGGAQTSNFDIVADSYEANRHFFLSQYFRDHYNESLSQIPIIQSQINITKCEVWITSKTPVADKDNRNILAFMDLGEKEKRSAAGFAVVETSLTSPSEPDNKSNALYNNLTTQFSNFRDFSTGSAIDIKGGDNKALELSKDFERVENARKLSPTEFTVNTKLGYISLNTQPLNNDEVLAVAFEYTIGNEVHRVGEFSTSGVEAPKALYLKLLKGKTINTRLPMWNLMMKNIYSINAYQINSKDFRLDVLYLDNKIGSNINYIPEGAIKGIPLIRVLKLDRLNSQLASQPDGVFDFVDGVTINKDNGRIIFPVVQPFGEDLKNAFGDPEIAKKYTFDSLYTTTQATARQTLAQNKFRLKGSYQSSSSSEISLNALNIPQGSVVVTAGGNKLVEGSQYTVDYTLGRVRITDEGILQSGVPIKITTESNALFSIQTKSLMGSRFDYMVNKELNLGGTILNLTERPLTKKVNIGDEPISNTIFGLDGTFHRDSRFITKLVDNIPFIDTKETSNITLNAEYAQLVPGHASAIGKSGTAYIDDFEGSKTPIDLKSPYSWYMASTPQGQPSLFPEGVSSNLNNRIVGSNRARMSWYTIDPIFTKQQGNTPDNITPEEMADDYVRDVQQQELFPAKQLQSGVNPSLQIFNLAYYPTERGPYNYNVTDLNTKGKFKTPSTKWAGIMRKVETTDFDASNIEFIEFWMMDPFVKGANQGGELYFNLGNVSEDILRDGKKSVENGLPTDGNLNDGPLISTTTWGKIPSVQPVVTAFDNEPAARVKQDVGLDGLPDNTSNGASTSEEVFFKSYLDSLKNIAQLESGVYEQFAADPSGDDFHYYKGDEYDNFHILQRYKRYNDHESNSKVNTSNAPPASATNIPDAEDVNKDNTLDQLESYFQYKVDLKPGRMFEGQNYIASVVDAKVPGTSRTVKWYQFKIPIRKPEQKVGSIEDFKSIRFIRMFMKGFQDSMICRFGKLQFVRGEWRRFTENLLAPGEHLGANDNFDQTTFDVSTINLEENGERVGIPYVLPPGIDRQIIAGTTSLQKLNEQSLLLKVCDLQDGDGRAAFKNTQFDIRQYKKLNMYIHAEAGSTNSVLRDGDVTCFVRLGNDFSDNYYEIEVPLKTTSPGSTSPEFIWPSDNNLEIDLEKLQELKALRNNAKADITQPFPKDGSFRQGTNVITVKGVPNLSNVRTVMIGIRNPKQSGKADVDDGQPKCAEVWVNELRMTDFDENGGWAANARMTTKLADFGTVTVSGSKSTPGFGGIEQKINERKKEELTQYDVSSSLELGKFLPQKSGIKIPMYVGYSEAKSVPQFNPLDPDVKLKPYLEQLKDPHVRDSIENITIDYTQRKSLNFTNVKKNKVTGKPHIYDIENLNFTYAYSEILHHNINVENNLSKTYRGAVGYNFNTVPKNITPFSGIKSKNKYIKPISEINFYYSPSSISFRADADRQYSVNKLRPVSGAAIIDPTYNKIFNLSRFYDLKYDLTKSIKIDFNALNNSVVDEPMGPALQKNLTDTLRQYNYLGRNTKYHHTANVNWNVPINKFPITDWINLSIRYTVDYDWAAGPRIGDQGIKFGNTIQNAASTQYNVPLNMTSLYNKIPYFQKLAQRRPSYELNKGLATKPSKTAKDSVQEKKKRDPNALSVIDYFAKVLVSLKTINASYTTTNGTLLPGFTPVSQVIGQNFDTQGNAPGTAFVFGQQQKEDSYNNIRRVAERNNWLVKNDSLNIPFVQTSVKNLTLRGNMEPLPGLRIDLNANQNTSLNHQEIWRFDGTMFNTFNPVETGNYSVSFLSLNTAFTSDNSDHSSDVFEKMRNNRYDISRRLSNENPNSGGVTDPSGYFKGYSQTSQQVLIPAFLAAYSGKDPNKINLDPQKTGIKPNWRITYDGLSKIPLFAKYVSTIMLAHGYRSSFNINSFTRNVTYHEDNTHHPDSVNLVGDFISKYDIAQVSIAEQFSPLMSIDITWKNSLLTRFEYKKDRTLSMSFSNNQLTEILGHEYIIGAGYRLKKFKVPFKINKQQVTLQNDLDFKVDLSFRNNITIVRKLEERTNQPSAGTDMITIKTSIDYIVNERFNIRLFYDRLITTPIVSTSYPTSTTNAGISVRFTLSQ